MKINLFLKKLLIIAMVLHTHFLLAERSLHPISIEEIPREQREAYISFCKKGDASYLDLSSLDLRYAVSSLRQNGKKFRLNFSNSIISRANLANADLERTFFLRVIAMGTYFSKANLANSHFYAANLIKAIFTGANLAGANFRKANLTKVNFENADLSGADFSGAIIDDVNFNNANLTNVIGLN